jgi:hypothetical protein
MNKLRTGLIVAALLLLAAVAYYYFLRPVAPPPPSPTPVAVTADVPPAASAPPAEPQILHPLEAASEPAASAAAPAQPLPPLADSDSFVTAALNDLLGRRTVLKMLQVDGFVQRVVATVDNLPRKHASPRLWPVHPTAGRFTTLPADGALRVDPDNARRYLPLVQMVEAVDPARAAALYRRLYPLFQQAYRDLGYPQGYFNDRLVQVIDHLRATPQIEGPIAVTQTEVKGPYAATSPWLNVEFADPALQSLSAGQRALLRSGVVNQRRLLAWLTAFRAQIAR